MIKNITVASAFMLAFGLASFASLTTTALADGNGSPQACLGGPSVSADPVASYDAGPGNIVDGVCIKSGSNMFGGNQHSNVLGNGTYENGCYKVEGIGTQEVTVTRLKGGSSCQGISHIDIIVGEAPDGEDVCPNLDDIQTEVPEGLIRDENGDCVEPPELDVCPNIDDDQSQIPEGLVKDSEDNCVTPEDEEEPVVLGEQTEAPEGAVKAGYGAAASIVVSLGLAVSALGAGYGFRRLN